MRVSTGHRARSPRGRTGEGSDNDEKWGLNTAIWRQELGRRVVRHPDLTAFPVGRFTPDTGEPVRRTCEG
eukprot:scaffold76538_cov84-Phaeocystis_antarctica.AAC.2